MADDDNKKPASDASGKPEQPDRAEEGIPLVPEPLRRDRPQKLEADTSTQNDGTFELVMGSDPATSKAERDALLDEVSLAYDPSAVPVPDRIALPRTIDAEPGKPATDPPAKRGSVPLPQLDDNISSWEVLWLALIIIGAVLLRVAMIDQQPLLSDEFTTLISAERPFVESVTSFQDPQPPLYQVILRGLFEQYPLSPWILRGPAIVFGCISVAIGWWSLRTLFGSTVAALGSLVLATNGMMIAFSREARAYSLFVLLALLALTGFYRLVRTGSWMAFVAVVLFASLLPYSHYYGVFYLAMMLTYLAADWVLAGPSRKHGGRVVAAYVIAIVLTAPAWVLLVRQVIAGVPMAWWFQRPTAITAFDSLGDLLGIRALGVACVIPLIATLWLTRTSYDPLGKPGWINGRVRLTGWWRGRMHVLFAALWVGFGLFLPVVISRFHQPLFRPEHALPVIIPMIGLGLLFLTRSTRVGAVLVVVVVVGYNLRQVWHDVQPRKGMPDVVLHVARTSAVTDPVYVADWGRVPDFINPEVRALQFYGLPNNDLRLLPVREIEADPSGASVRLLTDEPMTIVCYGSTINPIMAHAEALGLEASWRRYDQLWVVHVNKPAGE